MPSSTNGLFLSARDVLHRGLSEMGISRQNRSEDFLKERFHAHYGSDPIILANQWYDLTVTTIPQSVLSKTENTKKGFREQLNFLKRCYRRATENHP